MGFLEAYALRASTHAPLDGGGFLPREVAREGCHAKARLTALILIINQIPYTT
jgi:hypothetical protein